MNVPPKRCVVDTSALIHWLIQSDLTNELARHMPDIDTWFMPTVVQLELLKWAFRHLEPDKCAELLAFSNTCQVVELNTDIAVLAAQMHQKHKLHTTDAIIYATALNHRAHLLTTDAHFSGLDGVTHITAVVH